MKRSREQKNIVITLAMVLSVFLTACGTTEDSSMEKSSVRSAASSHTISKAASEDPDASRQSKSKDTEELPSENSNYISVDTYGNLEVPYLSQSGMPTACESACAVMALRYYGAELSLTEFVQTYLDIAALPREERGVLVGESPETAFIGDPFSADGYGCFAPVIEKAINRIPGMPVEAEAQSGHSLQELADKYLPQGSPILVWVTINMAESYESDSWIIESSGERFTWPAEEHCMVLIGQSSTEYHFLDPYQENGFVRYSKDLTEQRYQELSMQAVTFS